MIRATHDVCKSIEHRVTAVAGDYHGLTELRACALDRFAIVQSAGKFIVEFEILPFSPNEIDESVLNLWKIWLDDSTKLSDADRGVRNGASFCKNMARRDSIQAKPMSRWLDQAGYRHKDLFLFTDIGFKEACGLFETRQVAAELLKQRLLVIDDPSRFKCKHSVPGQIGRQRFYIVKGSILEDNEALSE